MSNFAEISEALQKGKAKAVGELVQKAIDGGASPKDILDQGLLSGMNEIGEKFKNNDIFVPEVLMAARAMNAGVALLRPLLVKSGVKPLGKIVIGTVKGDLHDIGKNLVRMMFEGKGFEVIDLGVDVSADDYIKTAVDNDAIIIACAAMLTTTTATMKEVIDKLSAMGKRDQFKVMVGGAPINQKFCETIGADAYSADAAAAADRAVAFVQ